MRLKIDLTIAHKTYRSDPFENVLPRHLGSGSIQASKLATIEENTEKVNCDVTQGNTCCRAIYDSANIYSGLELSLPSMVFVKLYHYFKQFSI